MWTVATSLDALPSPLLWWTEIPLKLWAKVSLPPWSCFCQASCHSNVVNSLNLLWKAYKSNHYPSPIYKNNSRSHPSRKVLTLGSSISTVKSNALYWQPPCLFPFLSPRTLTGKTVWPKEKDVHTLMPLLPSREIQTIIRSLHYLILFMVKF